MLVKFAGDKQLAEIANISDDRPKTSKNLKQFNE